MGQEDQGSDALLRPWDNPDAPLREVPRPKGRTSRRTKTRPEATAVTVKDVAKPYLDHKQAPLDAAELSPLTFGNYMRAADTLVAHIGESRLVSDLNPTQIS